MKNIILILAVMLFGTVGFAQIKVTSPNGFVKIGDTGTAPVRQLDITGNMAFNPAAGANTTNILGVNANARLQVQNFNNTTDSRCYFVMFGDDIPNPSRSGEMTFASTYSRFFTGTTSGGSTPFGIERMRIDDNGDIGIGITNPDEKLHVAGNILATGTVTSSDRRLKTNITKFERGLSDVMNIFPKSYNYNGLAGISSDRLHVGLIAQELEQVAPELVGKYDFVQEDIDRNIVEEEEYYYVDENAIKYMLVNAVKEQQEMIKELQNEVKELREILSNNQEINTESVILKGNGNAYLGQNNPNPYSEITYIDYELPRGTTKGEIVFHSLNGQLLKRVNLEQQIGQISIQALDLPTGTYTYSLVIDSRVHSIKKMILSNK